MKALLLAAGYGSRLRPLTNTVPKCLVPIKGKPLLGIWLERLTKIGIGPFLINTHYLSREVENFIENSDFNKQVTLVHELELKGTAGTLIENLDFFQGEGGLVIHADNFCLADFSAFLKAHQNRPPDCLMSMMTFRTKTPSLCGIVELDKRNIVIDFHEKISNPPSNLANSAIYILTPELMKILDKEMKFVKDFSLEVIHQFIGRIYSYETKELFYDIGTPEEYLKANQ
jgi:mannose-1-phosphate guanylyltransferase